MKEDLIARFKQMLDEIDGDRHKWIVIITNIPYIDEINRILNVTYTIAYDPRWKWSWKRADTSSNDWLKKEKILEWYTRFVESGIYHTIGIDGWEQHNLKPFKDNEQHI